MCFSVSSNIFINGHHIRPHGCHGVTGYSFRGFMPGCFGWGFGGLACNPWGAFGLGLGYAVGNNIFRGLMKLF